MGRFALTPRNEWRQRQPVMSSLQRNFGSQWGQRRSSSGSSGGHCVFAVPSARATLGLSVGPSGSMRYREVWRQPGSSGPGNSCCGGALAKGLKAGVAASARRARCSRIFLITAGPSMLAHTLTAPPQCSQVKMSILAKSPGAILSSGSNTTSVVPSRQGVLRW